MNPVMEMAVGGQITFCLLDNGFDILELDQSKLDKILQAIAEDKLLEERFQTIVIEYLWPDVMGNTWVLNVI